jgi:hypothetical protein
MVQITIGNSRVSVRRKAFVFFEYVTLKLPIRLTVSNGEPRDPRPLDPFLNIVRALAGSELDNPKVGEAVCVKRIFFNDAFDDSSIPADRDDDSAITWDLSTGHDEIS